MTGEELRMAYKNSGLKGSEFASKLGISREYLYDLFLTKEIENKYVNKLQNKLQNTTKSIPLIPIDAVAGYGKGDVSVLSLDVHEHYVVPDFTNKADYLIRISGNSMAPKYYNGDVVAVKKVNELNFVQWGKVYVIDTDQGAICKRLNQSKIKGNVICVSDNDKNYPPFELPIKQMRSIGIVVGVIRVE